MKKTLLICEKYPLPENFGGAMRTMNFVRFFLRQNSKVEILYSGKQRNAGVENNYFSNEYQINLKPLSKNYKGHIKRIFNRIPHPIYEYTEESKRTIEKIINSNKYEYILFRRYVSLGNIHLQKEVKDRVIVDFDDIVSGPLYNSHFYPTIKIYKKVLRFLNWKLLKWYENRCLRFGASVFCSAKDSVLLAGTKKKNVFIVPNIYDSGSFGKYDFGEGFGKEHHLLFMGSLDYGPNIDGLIWFINSIYFSFKAVNPKASLVVVGKDPVQAVKEICGEAGIQLEPNVPDVKGYYRKCGAVVVPILTGGGTRIKILEAAAAGRPVLSTPLGADGLDLSDGAEILLFNSSADFIKQHRMLGCRDTYNSIVRAAKSAITSKFSMKVFEKGMQKVIECIEQRPAIP